MIALGNKLSLRKRLASLSTIVASLLRTRAQLEQVLRPELLTSLVSVLNPLFGFSLVFAVVPIIAGVIALCVSGILLLLL